MPEDTAVAEKLHARGTVRDKSKADTQPIAIPFESPSAAAQPLGLHRIGSE